MKISVCQLLIEGGEPERNFKRAELMLEISKKKQCDIALFPETIDFAWTHPSGLEEADTIPGAFSNKLCSLAKYYKIFICVGLTEKTEEGNYNTALLINSEGHLIGKYRKINLLEVEFPYYLIGSSLSVFDSPFGKIGVNICSDNYSDALSIGNCLARMGASCILSPSSWTVNHNITEEQDPYGKKWQEPLSYLAKTFKIPVLVATGVGYIVGGPYEGKKMIGKSIVVQPDGSIQEGIVNEFSGSQMFVDLNLSTATYQGVLIGERLRALGYPY